MTWTGDELALVKRALLGTWPGTIVQWGADAIDAYLYVFQARGLTADEVLKAIGTWPAGSDFPPSAPNLAAQARKDPGRPSFDEAWALIRVCLAARTPVRKAIWETGERDRRDEEAMVARARQPDIHPLIALFIERQGGPRRLRSLGLDDEENPYREVRRATLKVCWEQFCEDTEGRDVAALAAGRRGQGLGHLDPLQAIRRGAEQIKRAELEAAR